MKLTLPKNPHTYGSPHPLYQGLRQGFEEGSKATIASVAKQIEDWITSHADEGDQSIGFSGQEYDELLTALKEAQNVEAD